MSLVIQHGFPGQEKTSIHPCPVLCPGVLPGHTSASPRTHQAVLPPAPGGQKHGRQNLKSSHGPGDYPKAPGRSAVCPDSPAFFFETFNSFQGIIGLHHGIEEVVAHKINTLRKAGAKMTFDSTLVQTDDQRA